MRFALLMLLVAAACGPATSGTAAAPNHIGAVQPTPTPTRIPMDVWMGMGMGGAIPDATVFTLVGNEIHAVYLLNHHVPYRISVSGVPHAVVSPDGSVLYVADRVAEETRVRSFDVPSGAELASIRIAEDLADGRALAVAPRDRLFVLVRARSSSGAAAGMRVDEFDGAMSRKGPTAKAECADRVLASETRLTLICASTGQVDLHMLMPDGSSVALPPLTLSGAPIVASAMLESGVLLIGTQAGTVHKIDRGGTQVVGITEIGEGRIVPHGIAGAAGSFGFVVFERSEGKARATVHDLYFGTPRLGPYEVDLRGEGVVAFGRFAYYAGEGGLWHVDLEQGLVERMLTLDDPIPLAVVGH